MGTFSVDNSDGTRASGRIFIARRMDVFGYMNFLWALDLHNQANAKVSSVTQAAPGTTNKAPVLNTIGEQRVAVGQSVEFIVTASDPDGDAVTLSVQNLPPGATFDPATGRFRWTTPPAGRYRDILFKATQAGSTPLSDAEVVDILVAPSFASASAASFGTPLAVESITAGFGSNLATATQVASTLPLPTELEGTVVEVRDSAGTVRRAPLFFISPGQINYQVPPGTALGTATLSVTNRSGVSAIGATEIALVGPGLFAANANGQGVPAAVALRVRTNGTRSNEEVARFDPATNRFFAVPIDLGPEGEQVFLLLFGTGFRLRTGLQAVTIKIGGTDAEVLFAGPQGDFVGLDQLNVRVPRSLVGRGDVDVVLTVDGKPANILRINVK